MCFLLFPGLIIAFKNYFFRLLEPCTPYCDKICFSALLPRGELETGEVETIWHHPSLEEAELGVILLPEKYIYISENQS